MHKLSHTVADQWEPHSHQAVFSVRDERVLAGVPGGDPTAFTRLVACLEAPYFLLYVLHTPRGEGHAGRYQSPALSRQQVLEFVQRFGGFLSADARFDLWAHSPADQATVVWDRHNQLFAYGPVERYVAQLEALGFSSGDAGISFPHQHHYRAEFDADARALLESLDWAHSPLQPEDEQ